MSRKSVLALTAIAALSTSCLVPTDASARVGAYAARSSHFAGVRASRSVARPAISRSFTRPSINRGFAHPTVSRSPVVKWSRFTNHSVAGRPAAGQGSHIIWQRPLNHVTNPSFAPRSGKLVVIPTPGPLQQPGGPVPGSPPAPPPNGSGTSGTPSGGNPGTPPNGPGTPPNGPGISGNPPTGPGGPVIVNIPGPVTRPVGTVIVTGRPAFGLPTVGTYGRVAQATPVNPAAAYLAIALAWNDNGAWIARIDTSIGRSSSPSRHAISNTETASWLRSMWRRRVSVAWR